MIFTYKNWQIFCEQLSEMGIYSVPSNKVFGCNTRFLTLKHDVETDVKKAYEIANIENRFGHRGSYYVQAYLLKKSKNVNLLLKMQDMGHEISYHHDVLDSSKGDIDKAIEEFKYNIISFEQKGFEVTTVCQHGNPIVERKGYFSNRDFFRNEKVRLMFPNITDIMVNYKSVIKKEYEYFSDAGRMFQLIFDPLNNDIVNSDDQNISYINLDALFKDIIVKNENCIISMHPHRWTKVAITSVGKKYIFQCVKRIARIFEKNKALRKVMSKYYYLAKKF